MAMKLFSKPKPKSNVSKEVMQALRAKAKPLVNSTARMQIGFQQMCAGESRPNALRALNPHLQQPAIHAANGKLGLTQPLLRLDEKLPLVSLQEYAIRLFNKKIVGEGVIAVIPDEAKKHEASCFGIVGLVENEGFDFKKPQGQYQISVTRSKAVNSDLKQLCMRIHLLPTETAGVYTLAKRSQTADAPRNDDQEILFMEPGQTILASDAICIAKPIDSRLDNEKLEGDTKKEKDAATETVNYSLLATIPITTHIQVKSTKHHAPPIVSYGSSGNGLTIKLPNGSGIVIPVASVHMKVEDLKLAIAAREPSLEPHLQRLMYNQTTLIDGKTLAWHRITTLDIEIHVVSMTRGGAPAQAPIVPAANEFKAAAIKYAGEAPPGRYELRLGQAEIHVLTSMLIDVNEFAAPPGKEVLLDMTIENAKLQGLASLAVIGAKPTLVAKLREGGADPKLQQTASVSPKIQV